MENAFDLQNYLLEPLTLPFDIEVESLCETKTFARFFAVGSDIPLIKYFNVRRAVKILSQKDTVTMFSFKFSWERKPKAFMHDDGYICLSAGLMNSVSSPVLLSVFCHEFAHVLLRSQADYDELKQLERAFKNKYRERKEVDLIAPVEVYAMVLSVKLMERIQSNIKPGKKKDKFIATLQDEKKKLQFLKNVIEELNK